MYPAEDRRGEPLAEIIFYATRNDIGKLVEWLNSESCIAWIVKESQAGNEYRWRAVQAISSIEPTSYALWHVGSRSLIIPSGAADIADATIINPFAGWTQILDGPSQSTPWFGGLLPGPYELTFKPSGKETDNSIGRSGFAWNGNYFRSIGKGADAQSERWWHRLKRVMRKEAIGISWPANSDGKTGAYAFPEAYVLYRNGVHLDVNP
jgi:hypothetical protein